MEVGPWEQSPAAAGLKDGGKALRTPEKFLQRENIGALGLVGLLGSVFPSVRGAITAPEPAPQAGLDVGWDEGRTGREAVRDRPQKPETGSCRCCDAPVSSRQGLQLCKIKINK